MAYYFLVAQLPHISYSAGEPPITSAAFRELCKSALSKSDAALLDYCTLGISGAERSATASDFINRWRARERTLVLTLAALRAQKLKKEAPSDVPHDSLEAETQARAAFALENPLEAELLLDKGRWDALESLTGTDYFSVNVVYAYLIKLLLLERRCSFKTEEGFAEYQALYSKILNAAPGGATKKAAQEAVLSGDTK